VALGYATHRPDTRRYAIGGKAWALGRKQFLAGKLAEIARPVLRDLQAMFAETVLLTVYRDGLRHTVASVESQHHLRVGGQAGIDDHLYGTATGRVLLSLLGSGTLAAFIRDRGLPENDWPEAVSEAELRRHLSEIRDAGFTLYERQGGHIQAAAAPVLIAEPDTYVALGMYYPTVRPPEGGTANLKRLLTEAAAAIAAEFERRG